MSLRLEITSQGQCVLLLNAREVLREDEGEKLILLVLGDITEKRKSEKELEKREGHFRLVAETLPQLIWATDHLGKFEYLNLQLINYSEE